MKHSPQQLRDMAAVCLQARDTGDPRYLQLVLEVAVKAGKSPLDVASWIEQTASVSAERARSGQ